MKGALEVKESRLIAGREAELSLAVLPPCRFRVEPQRGVRERAQGGLHGLLLLPHLQPLCLLQGSGAIM